MYVEQRLYNRRLNDIIPILFVPFLLYVLGLRVRRRGVQSAAPLQAVAAFVVVARPVASSALLPIHQRLDSSGQSFLVEAVLLTSVPVILRLKKIKTLR